MRLKQNLRPMLELESGSNDPMAYVLTIVLIQVAQLLFDPVSSIEGINYTQLVVGSLVTLVLQMSLGALAGVAIGFATVWILQRIKLNSTPLYSILLLAVSMFAFSMTQMIQGNGYLAVYIAGFIIGNKPMNNRKEILSFMDGMTWIMQIGMFLSLGLLVNPHEMLHVAPIALLIGLFLLFVGRPLTVLICLLPFRKISFRAKLFTSWVGLKGAVPIIFATYPIVAGIPGSEQIFNIVFFITLLSLIFQGMSIPRVARLLHLNLPEEKAPDTFGIEIPEEAGKLQDYTLTDDDLTSGNTLKEINLPEGARVVIIRRDSKFIIPDGSVELRSGDQLLIIYGEVEEELPGIKDIVEKVKAEKSAH